MRALTRVSTNVPRWLVTATLLCHDAARDLLTAALVGRHARRGLVTAALLCSIAGAGLLAGPTRAVVLANPAPAVDSQAVTPMSAEAREQLAPSGRLRAALNYSNDLLVSARAPEHTGVAPDLARELARRAKAAVEFVGYANAGLAADAVRDLAWDVAFIGAEPARAGAITFSPAYVEIEATYLVPGTSPIQSLADVDRAGTRIATTARAAYTLALQRTLRHATLVEADTIPGAVELFTRSNLDALAGLTPRLLADAKTIPGARVLAGRFTAVQQALGVPKERAAAAAYVAAFVSEVKSSGLLRELIARHGAHGLTVAP